MGPFLIGELQREGRFFFVANEWVLLDREKFIFGRLIVKQTNNVIIGSKLVQCKLKLRSTLWELEIFPNILDWVRAVLEIDLFEVYLQ